MADLPKGIHMSDWAHYVKIVGGGSDEGGAGSMRFMFGESNPTQSDGQPGDIFLNTKSGDIFSNENGSWVNKGNLKGPKGDTGAKGTKGDTGAAGKDAEQQFTAEEVTALKKLITE